MKRMILFLISIALIVGVTGCGSAESIETSSGESMRTGISESAPVSDVEPVSPDAEFPQASTPEPLIEEEPQSNEWEFGKPEDHGIDTALLAEIDGQMAASQMLAAVIVKDGVIIDEF